MKNNIQHINSKKRKQRRKYKDNKKEETNFCEVCGGPMHNETYGWHPELNEYFLVGEDGTLQLDQPLEDEYVEDDVREFIAMKKEFG